MRDAKKRDKNGARSEAVSAAGKGLRGLLGRHVVLVLVGLDVEVDGAVVGAQLGGDESAGKGKG